MMASFAGASRTIVIRTSRDTLGLLVAATAVTFALSYAVHSKHVAQVSAPVALSPVIAVSQASLPQQDWAGRLTELTPATPPAEPMTSASLTVPKSQLALPTPPRPVARPRPCVEPQACAAKAMMAAGPSAPAQHHQVAAGDKPPATAEQKSIIGMLNPMNHLPDMSLVGRPFTYAGGAVTGWFKRL